jgi:hypothetical protein
MKSRREKEIFSGGGYQCVCGGIRNGRMRVNIVDIFHIKIKE